MKAQHTKLFVFAFVMVTYFAATGGAQDMPHDMLMPTPTPKLSPTPTPSPKLPMDMQMPTATPAPQPTATPAGKPPEMSMPMPANTPTPAPPLTTAVEKTLGNLSLGADSPEPVADDEVFGSVLFDVLEFRPSRGNSDFRWDIAGWRGTDKNRFWYKSEGQRNTALKADYDIDLQLLYGRMVHPYFDLQMGVRFETQKFRGANVTRPQVVLGLDGLLPYFWELESAVFIDPKGNVSGRASLTKDFLITNRWILQGRLEANAALQEVERFTTGRGLNNIETGLRLRYEVSRRFAPYVGLTYDRSFFDTARFVRNEGGDPSQLRLVGGIRLRF